MPATARCLDALIERRLSFETRRLNRGYPGYDDWRDEVEERPAALADVSVGEILQHAIGIEPGRWSRADQMRVAAYLSPTCAVGGVFS